MEAIFNLEFSMLLLQILISMQVSYASRKEISNRFEDGKVNDFACTLKR